MTRDIWEKAGEISASLRRKGITIPLSDLMIAALALSGGYDVFTINPHFEQAHGLKLTAFLDPSEYLLQLLTQRICVESYNA